MKIKSMTLSVSRDEVLVGTNIKQKTDDLVKLLQDHKDLVATGVNVALMANDGVLMNDIRILVEFMD